MLTEKRDCLVLHLSDLHLGEHSLSDEDGKERFEGIDTRARYVDRLRDYLVALPRRPDFVVVSGDTTVQSDPTGFREFLSLVDAMQDAGAMPSDRNILIVPGNHDAAWADDIDAEASRFATFIGQFGNRFANPWFSGVDPDPEHIILSNRFTSRTGVWGGTRPRFTAKKGVVRQSLPFLLDREAGLLLYAFNSARLSGAITTAGGSVADSLRRLKTIVGANSEGIEACRVADAALSRIRHVDAPWVGADQLRSFRRLMHAIRDRIGVQEFASLVKIAVLHHHVTSLPLQQTEIKRFESLIDGAIFKGALSEYGVTLVFHGHKHLPAALEDCAELGSSDPRLVVLSGGTIGGAPARGAPRCFNLVSLERRSVGPASVSFQRVEVEMVRDPRAAVESLPRVPLAEFGASRILATPHGFMNFDMLRGAVAQARQRLVVVGVKNSRLCNMGPEILDAVRRGVDVRILFLSPTASPATHHEVSRYIQHPGSDLARTIELNIDLFRTTRQTLDALRRRRVRCRTYATLTAPPAVLCDSEIYASYYFDTRPELHRTTLDAPYFVVPAHTAMGGRLAARLEDLWVASKPETFEEDRRAGFIFDLDGTLCRWEDYDAGYWRALANTLSAQTGGGASAVASRVAALRDEYFSRHQRSAVPTDVVRLLGIDAKQWSRAIVEAVAPPATLGKNWELRGCLADAAHEAHLAVVTNNVRAQADRLLKAVGVADLIDTIISYEDLDEAKPSRSALIRLCDNTRLPREAWVAMGNDDYRDLTAARSLGMRAEVTEGPEAVCSAVRRFLQ